jgi:hypothetical protein
MSNLARLAIDHGDRLMSASYALETIANLLGCDGFEHHLGKDDINGLNHAIRALAGYSWAAGSALYEAAEQEAKQ